MRFENPQLSGANLCFDTPLKIFERPCIKVLVVLVRFYQPWLNRGWTRSNLILKANRHAVLGDRTDKVEDAHIRVVVTLVPERAASEAGVVQNHERCTNNDPHKTHVLGEPVAQKRVHLLKFGGSHLPLVLDHIPGNADGSIGVNLVGYNSGMAGSGYNSGMCGIISAGLFCELRS